MDVEQVEQIVKEVIKNLELRIEQYDNNNSTYVTVELYLDSEYIDSSSFTVYKE